MMVRIIVLVLCVIIASPAVFVRRILGVANVITVIVTETRPTTVICSSFTFAKHLTMDTFSGGSCSRGIAPERAVYKWEKGIEILNRKTWRCALDPQP